MRIDLVQLRTIVAVAEEQHLTRAAERLFISQSAASAHVRALEDQLDTQLFVRTNRSLELTRAGQLLARKAKALLNEEAQFTSFARELRGNREDAPDKDGNAISGMNPATGMRSIHGIATSALRCAIGNPPDGRHRQLVARSPRT